MCLVFVIDQSKGCHARVLLGLKHRGVGVSNVVGLGGHIDPGETARDAAVREAFEEAGVVLTSTLLRDAGQVRFRFPSKPAWDQDVSIFTSTEPVRALTASDEITPQWHDVDGLPLAWMWDDARYWLPETLSGLTVDATATFADDNPRSCGSKRLHPTSRRTTHSVSCEAAGLVWEFCVVTASDQESPG